MYIFGGKDDENDKLCDLWKFNFSTGQWSQVQFQNDALLPRSGHSASVFGDFMVIFGGIYEVTKELNDMHIFHMKTEKWACLFEEYNSPKKMQRDEVSSPIKNALAVSTNQKRNTIRENKI